jgi:hypothetical protein
MRSGSQPGPISRLMYVTGRIRLYVLLMPAGNEGIAYRHADAPQTP